MKALIYARVSTKKQAKEHTIDYQLTECKALAKDNNLEIVETITDKGISGTSLTDREFKNLIERIDSGKIEFDILVVYSVDRIFREDIKYENTNDAKLNALRIAKVRRSIRDVAEIKGVLITNEIKILEKGSGFQKVSDELFSIKQTLAGVELDKTRSRTRDGHIDNMVSKNLPPVGNLPYGFKIKRDKRGRMIGIEADEEKAQNLRWIFQSVIDNGPGKTIEALNEKGIQTPSSGKIWYNATVWFITTNVEKYFSGNWEYNYQGKVYNIKYPSLISRELYESVERSRLTRRPRHDKSFYLTTGTAYCGACNRGLYVNNHTFEKTKTKIYAMCRQCKTRCHYPELENAIWNGVIVRLLQIAFESGKSKPLESIADQIKIAKEELKGIDGRIEKLAELAIAGLDISVFKKLNSKLQTEKLQAESKLLRLKDTDKKTKSKANRKKTFEENILNTLNEVFNPIELKRKRELLQTVIMSKRVKVEFKEYYNPTITMPAYNGFDEFSFKVNENPFGKIEWGTEAKGWASENSLWIDAVLRDEEK